MKKLQGTIYMALVVFGFACQEQSQETQLDEANPPSPDVVNLVEETTSINQAKSEASPEEALADETTESETKEVEIEEIKPVKALSPQQRLINSLDKAAKIEYAGLDNQVIKNDTLIEAHNNQYEISYETRCMNDSLIAQVMYDYGGTNSKSYLISHNYKTDIAIKVDGILKGNKAIRKEMFNGKLDQEFLERSILKHPQFVRFDPEKNEAIFEFIVGIPNTDWLVLAGVNLSEDGEIRIIDIMIPEL